MSSAEVWQKAEWWSQEQYQVKISNIFAAFKNLDDDLDITKAWESIRENIKASATQSLRLLRVETA